MNRKNDKKIIVIGILLLYVVISWFVKTASFDANGEFLVGGAIRIGLFEFIYDVFAAFAAKIDRIFYILCIGGMYGILVNTNFYKRLIKRICNFVKGKENIFFIVVTLIVSIYASITKELLAPLIVVPFIISIFLKLNYDRLTAVSASFGAIIIGFMGQTIGTYGITSFAKELGISYNAMLLEKIIFFIISYVLYALFCLYHMKRIKRKDYSDEDLFYVEDIKDGKLKKKAKTKYVLSLIFAVLFVVFIFIGYISWSDSFGIKFFSELHKKLQSAMSIGGVPILSTIFGNSLSGIGEWKEFATPSLIIILFSLIVGLLNKQSLGKMVDNFSDGVKKIFKVAFIYGLVHTISIMYQQSPWFNRIIQAMLSNTNAFTLFFAGFVLSLVAIEFGYGPFVPLVDTAKVDLSVLALRTGSALSLIVSPTSAIILMALTYLDISYKKWFKYIWKFVLAYLLLAMLFMAVVVFM